MTTHTKGPWHIGLKPGPIIYDQHGAQIVSMREALLPDDENMVNAKLIAAAPELLAALVEFENLALGIYQSQNLDEPYEASLSVLIDKAQATIARARGQS